ncbi:MAG: tRNA adenosine(34) deaminase TadA [Clostridia bacterium]|nr:tRNA adenosine(34) deaminase TadA [Clostridia bacterium]
MKKPEFYMKKAIKQAYKAESIGEVPIGAVIVLDGKVIASAYNKRNSSHDATSHAEILAIKKACKKLGDWRLDGAEMYVTLEPCPMCAGAIINARIKKVYFGAYEKKSGAVMSNYRILFSGSLNHKADAEGGILEKECSSILKKFFSEKR